jgi:hypothetical protein
VVVAFIAVGWAVAMGSLLVFLAGGQVDAPDYHQSIDLVEVDEEEAA